MQRKCTTYDYNANDYTINCTHIVYHHFCFYSAYYLYFIDSSFLPVKFDTLLPNIYVYTNSGFSMAKFRDLVSLDESF